MIFMERKKELEYLIKKYDKAYEEGHPLITDTEYDILYNELIELEKKYGVSEESPTRYIEDAKIRHLNKVVHDSPMLSQEKCHTKEDIINFVNRINDTKYIVDLKLDGISISLKYKEGLNISFNFNNFFGSDSFVIIFAIFTFLLIRFSNSFIFIALSLFLSVNISFIFSSSFT